MSFDIAASSPATSVVAAAADPRNMEAGEYFAS